MIYTLKLCLSLSLALTIFASAAGAQTPQFVTLGELQLPVPQGWYVGADATDTQVALASDQSPEEQAITTVSKVPARYRSLDSMLMMARNQIIMRMDGVIDSTVKHKVDGRPAFTLRYTGHSSSGENRAFARTVIDSGNDLYIVQSVMPLKNSSQHAGAIEALVKGSAWMNPQTNSTEVIAP